MNNMVLGEFQINGLFLISVTESIISLNNYKSYLSDPNFGVSQGSILGPL